MSEITSIDTRTAEQSNHFLKTHYAEVSEALSELGYENELLAELKPETKAGVEMPEGAAITPEMSEPVRDTIQKCQFPFTLDTELEGCYGDGEGSANTTTVFEKTGMAVQEAFELLDMTGQLERARDILEARSDETDMRVNNILAYAMATLSKGWVAEKILDGHPRWKTGSVSQDQGGLDLYDRELDTWVQLKPITVLASNGPAKFENKSAKHLFYMWTAEGTLEVTDTESWKEMKNREAKKAGVSATLLIKSPNLKINKEYGRRFRYLWW